MGFESTLKQTASDVEAVMSDLLAFNGAAARTVIDAMRYSALGQGKRLRPFFVTESARAIRRRARPCPAHRRSARMHPLLFPGP